MTKIGAGPIFRFSGPGGSMNGVVVDCANLIYNRREVEIGRLISVLELIESKGWPCYAGLKEGTFYKITKYLEEIPDKQKSLLETLEAENRITLIPSKEDDRYLLRLSLEGEHYLVSNDKYRDWIKENPKLKREIESRLRKVVFIGLRPTIEIPDCPSKTIIGGQEKGAGMEICIRDESGNQHSFRILDTIGRDSFEKSSLEILQPDHISREHLQFSKLGGQIVAIDLGSTNGTIVDGFRLVKNIPCPIQDGSVLAVGSDKNKLVTYPNGFPQDDSGG